MQLKRTTDYAIRVLLVLTKHPGYMTMPELSKAVCANPAYLVKVVRMLRDFGWIRSQRSDSGGYEFVRTSASITLLDVMKVMGDSVKLGSILEDDFHPNRDIYETFKDYKKQTEEHFNNYLIWNRKAKGE